MAGFRKATREGLRARIALMGPTGSGKTMTAMKLARYIGSATRIIDTERRSASRYAPAPGQKADGERTFDFDVLELDDHTALGYTAAIEEAAIDFPSDGVLIIDSFSHAWLGMLEEVDRVASRSQSKNSFAAWREVTPAHNKLMDLVVSFPGHLIVTMRSKMEYILEEGRNGTKIPRKVGMAPIQRDGVAYEFDIVGDMDGARLMITKTRCDALHDRDFVHPGRELGNMIKTWLGTAPSRDAKAAPASAAVPPPPTRPDTLEALFAAITRAEAEAWRLLAPRFAECHANAVTMGPLKSAYEAAGKAFDKPSPAFYEVVSRHTKQAREAIEGRIAAAKAAQSAAGAPPPSPPPAGPTGPAPEPGRESAKEPKTYAIPEGTPPEECRSCKATIYWTKTEAGKACPVNADGVTHFATCPNASEHSAKPRSKGGRGAAKETPGEPPPAGAPPSDANEDWGMT